MSIRSKDASTATNFFRIRFTWEVIVASSTTIRASRMGDAPTLHVRGAKNVSVYRARLREIGSKRATLSTARRHFCAKCGSALWAFDPQWPQWVYPFASAIDTPLPRPPEEVEMMLEFAAPWALVPRGKAHTHFQGYPKEGIADWHSKRGLDVA